MYVGVAECLSIEDPIKTMQEMGRKESRKQFPESLDDIPLAIPMLGPAFSKGFITLERLMQTLVLPIPKLLKRDSFLPENSALPAQLLEYQDEIRKVLVLAWTNGLQDGLKGR